MKQMNIDPANIEKVVISHDHWDHTGGLWDLLEERKGLNVYSCPGFSWEFNEKVDTAGGFLQEADGFS